MSIDDAWKDPFSTTAEPTPIPPGAWRLLWRYVRPHRAAIAVGMVLSLLSAATSLAQPIAMVHVINAVTASESILRPLAVLSALFLLDGLFAGLQVYVLLRTGESFAYTLRTRMIGTLLMWPVRTTERYRSGDLVARVSGDVTNIRSVLSDGTVGVFGAATSLVGAIILMGAISWSLLLVSVLSFLVVAAAIAYFLGRVRTAAEAGQKASGDMAAGLDRAISGFRTVVASTMRDAERASIDDHARRAYRFGREAAGWESLSTPALILGMNAALLVIFGYGGAQVADGTLDIAVFISFILYFAVLVSPLMVGFEALNAIQRGLGSINRIEEVSSDDTVVTPSSNSPLPDDALSVTVTGARFGHSADRAPVVENLSFGVPAGSITALVGPSGAGKTTVLSLIAGFYRPQEGAVLLADVSVGELSEAQLFRRVAYVQQEAPILWGGLGENLRYGNDATEADILDICRDLLLQRLVDAAPDGLDTEVGDRGVALSGGERQRIAIARALLRRPRLLLLDEPTSQLDGASEAAVLRVLRRMTPECTVLLASHRESTIAAADHVVHLEPRSAASAPVEADAPTNPSG